MMMVMKMDGDDKDDDDDDTDGVLGSSGFRMLESKAIRILRY